jgi:hypothetical protein
LLFLSTKVKKGTNGTKRAVKISPILRMARGSN